MDVGKGLEKALKALKKAAQSDQEEKGEFSVLYSMNLSGSKKPKLLRRGVVEVTKALKKGEMGVVFIASGPISSVTFMI